MKVLVTGGAGFIGSNLAEALLRKGHQVSIIDDLSTGMSENVPADASFHEVDLASPVVDKILQRGNFEQVFHLAAQIDVRKSVENPRNDAEINILGGINLLESCVKHGVKKLIFASTGGAIYGEQETFPADEDHPARPVSPYGVAKLAFESYLYYYNWQYGLSYVALRLANVYGPRQNPHGEAGVVAIFCSKLLRGEKAVVYGDGLQTRDFVYVDDVVKAHLLGMDFKRSVVVNVGTGVETNINDIYEKIRAATGSPQERINVEAKPGEQRRSCISYRKIKRLMAWEPEVSLDQGIKRTVAYFRSRLRKQL